MSIVCPAMATALAKHQRADLYDNIVISVAASLAVFGWVLFCLAMLIVLRDERRIHLFSIGTSEWAVKRGAR